MSLVTWHENVLLDCRYCIYVTNIKNQIKTENTDTDKLRGANEQIGDKLGSLYGLAG